MNIFYPPAQEKLFLVMFVFGFVSGVVYDLFRIKRRLFLNNNVFLFFDDLVFSLVIVLSFLFTVFVANNGIFRWFEVFFCIVGYVAYHLTVSKPITFVCFVIIDFLKRLFYILLNPLLSLIRNICLLFMPLCNFACRLKKKNRILNHMYKLTLIRKC